MMQGTMVNPVLTHDVLVGIAASTGWSVVQVVLRWALQTGQVCVLCMCRSFVCCCLVLVLLSSAFVVLVYRSTILCRAV